jgi:hypothetical protein
MAAMRRTPVPPAAPMLAAALVLVAAACGGGDGPPAPARTTPVRSPAAGTVRLPADAPRTLDRPSAPAEIARAGFVDLAPPGATVTSASILATPGDPIDQIAFAWRRGDDPFAPETGFAVWQRSDASPPWRAVYAFTDEPAKQVLGVSIVGAEDLTGDGIDDILTFEQTGGSGACGTYRVMGPAPGSASELLRRRTCDAQIEIVDGAMRLREAVYAPEDPHCCPSAYRVTVLEWDGRAFAPTSSETTPA